MVRRLVKSTVAAVSPATHDPVTGLELVQAGPGGSVVTMAPQATEAAGRNRSEKAVIRRHRYVVDEAPQLAVRPGDVDPEQPLSDTDAHAMALSEALYWYERGRLPLVQDRETSFSRVLLDDICAKWVPGQAPLFVSEVARAAGACRVLHASVEGHKSDHFTGPSDSGAWEALRRHVEASLSPAERFQREYMDTVSSLRGVARDWVDTGFDTREAYAHIEHLSATNSVFSECNVAEMCRQIGAVRGQDPSFGRIEAWVQSRIRDDALSGGPGQRLGGRLSPYPEDGWHLTRDGETTHFAAVDIRTGYEDGVLVRHRSVLPGAQYADTGIGLREEQAEVHNSVSIDRTSRLEPPHYEFSSSGKSGGMEL